MLQVGQTIRITQSYIDALYGDQQPSQMLLPGKTLLITKIDNPNWIIVQDNGGTFQIPVLDGLDRELEIANDKN